MSMLYIAGMTTPTPAETPQLPPVDLAAPLKTVQDTATTFSSETIAWLQSATLQAVSTVVIAVIFGFILRAIRKFLLKLIAGKDQQEPQQGVRMVAYRLIKNTSVIFLTIVGFCMVSLFLELPKGVQKGFDLAFMITGVLQAGLIVREIILMTIEQRFWNSSITGGVPLASALGVMGWLVNVAVWSLTGLLLLDNLGVNVTALIAGLGIGGLAIGLAAQGIISDLFSALSIVFDRPFVKDDFIIFGDKMGSVEKVGLKTTRVRALSGEMIVVSNNHLLGEVIHNYRQMLERRIVFTLGVEYSTSPDKIETIQTIIKQAIEEQKDCRFDRAHFIRFGESSLDFEVVYYFRGKDYNPYMDANQAILLKIMRAFVKENIQFAFPTRTIHITSPIAVTSL